MRLLEFLNREAALLREENQELRARAVRAEAFMKYCCKKVEEMKENHRKTVAELSTQYADELQKRLELAARVRELEDEWRAGGGKHDCNDCGNSGSEPSKRSEHCKHCVVGEIDGKRVRRPSHWTPRVREEESEDDI